GIIRLNPDGSEDTSFGANSTTGTLIEGAVYDIEATNDNKLYVVGSFATYDGVNTRGIVRIYEDGTRDTTFDVGAGFSAGTIMKVVPLSDGTVLAAGQISSYQGVVC